MIILDIGSGETIQKIDDFIELVTQISEYDTGYHSIVFKCQLFTNSVIKYLKPFKKDLFRECYDWLVNSEYSQYDLTASVFDMESLGFLEKFDVPFIKIACRDWVYPLIHHITKNIVVSLENPNQMIEFPNLNIMYMMCVPKYPAIIEEYENVFGHWLGLGISDHTENLELYKKHRPMVYERHLCSYHNDLPDRSSYASTPEEIGEIL